MSARVVFDLDGTLIDSAPDIRAVANEVLAGLGAGEITLAQTHDFIGNGVDVFVAKMRAALGLPDALQTAMAAAFRDRYADAHALTVLYPQVRETLEHLVASGHRLGLCTNKPTQATHAVLTHFDLAPLFETVVCGDTLPVHKPDPAPCTTRLRR
ncbi:HAD hydrolase-like protein [Sulfitobacter albidus]|uniref:HAD hydrolase-like protein n=1 Tax=Sulfitobacter albidus TaxID=2829501 RepID=UPI0032AF3E94